MPVLDEDLPELAPARPIWLMTLADLALLLVGFFVLLQSSQQLDRAALMRGLRAGFGVEAPLLSASPVPEPIAVSAAALRGFAPGSAVLPHTPDAVIAWAREATRDARVTLRIAGAVDGSPADVDPLTGSGAVLAADRARAVASALLVAHAVPATRLTIVAGARPAQRGVTLSTGFAGGRQ